MKFTYTQNPVLSTDFGLKFRPSINPEADKHDNLPVVCVDGVATPMNFYFERIHPEFSTGNKEVLLSILRDLKDEGRLKAILEVGVFRSREVSSTKCILDNKPQETKYFGIDLDEGNLAPIRDQSKNVFCFTQNSSNTDAIVSWCRGYGVSAFDLILIDGNHSVNQVLDDWRLVKHLAPGGVVLFHDTNYHPGPFCVFEAIDENLFEKEKFCTEGLDWGVGRARLK